MQARPPICFACRFHWPFRLLWPVVFVLWHRAVFGAHIPRGASIPVGLAALCRGTFFINFYSKGIMMRTQFSRTPDLMKTNFLQFSHRPNFRLMLTMLRKGTNLPLLAKTTELPQRMLYSLIFLRQGSQRLKREVGRTLGVDAELF